MNTPAPLGKFEVVAVEFDYSVLEPKVARLARQAADSVRGRHKRMMKSAINAGQELLAVKAALAHGLFIKWLEAEFGADVRTAQNYMRVADQFGNKSETVTYLPARTVYKLAAPSTPQTVREDVISKIEAGEKPAPDLIDDMVKIARETEKQAQRDAKLSDADRKKAAQRERAAERREEKRMAAHRAEREEIRRENMVGRRHAVDLARMIIDVAGDRLPELMDSAGKAGRFSNDCFDLIKAFGGDMRGIDHSFDRHNKEDYISIMSGE